MILVDSHSSLMPYFFINLQRSAARLAPLQMEQVARPHHREPICPMSLEWNKAAQLKQQCTYSSVFQSSKHAKMGVDHSPVTALGSRFAGGGMPISMPPEAKDLAPLKVLLPNAAAESLKPSSFDDFFFGVSSYPSCLLLEVFSSW
eukprot:CAMPEP_0202371264 /NCGR_PEP_ID=MMETSP1127-20130417/2702_1 /ASSEMBLY_ACC=CAM_ASM_000462 /TAXON_ID=3047 /ORGANISM="Dunaliella tertiolecta, Strain CCMP1320" /LENGTH=145 /DNA_ID=CAMNT_0048967449 /DNA_START=486 /DNA_END=920 /DNA_ORIENTATION=-